MISCKIINLTFSGKFNKKIVSNGELLIHTIILL